MHKPSSDQDQAHLKLALTLATQGRGYCAPNPAVGAVIVDRMGRVVATGFHAGPGLAHAEVAAFKQLTSAVEDATLYVTLEPCCHHGRTPPCTDVIIKHKVKRVVYAYQDPNPIVAGNGAAQLTAAGICCDHVPVPEIAAFYRSYQYWQQTKLPYLTAKIAMSLNGKIAGKNSERLQLTGAELFRVTHTMRAQADAILTSATTIHYDDPALNVRHAESVIAKPIYIIDRKLSMRTDAKVFSTAKSITIFHSRQCHPDLIQSFITKGARCIPIDEVTTGLDLPQIIAQLGKDGLHDVWVESGGKMLTALLQQQLLQRLFIYIAPYWILEGPDAFVYPFSPPFHQIKWQQLGCDLLGDVSLENRRVDDDAKNASNPPC